MERKGSGQEFEQHNELCGYNAARTGLLTLPDFPVSFVDEHLLKEYFIRSFLVSVTS